MEVEAWIGYGARNHCGVWAGHKAGLWLVWDWIGGGADCGRWDEVGLGIGAGINADSCEGFWLIGAWGC